MGNESQRRTAIGGMVDMQERLHAAENRVIIVDPIGSVRLFAAGAPNSRWSEADGAAVSREVHASLFARIGTTYGAGDGSTTFNLPNLPPVGGVAYYIKT